MNILLFFWDLRCDATMSSNAMVNPATNRFLLNDDMVVFWTLEECYV